MIRQILKAWKENRGNLLVLLGSLTGLLMCLIWHFQLVPEVGLMSRGVPGTLISATPRPNSSSLVAIVRRSARNPPTEGAGTSAGSGDAPQAIVEVYSPYDPLPHQAAPLLIQAVPLRDDGVPVAVVFADLQPGKYAAVAYIDFNDSGMFDTYQSGAETIVEPFCLARLPGPAGVKGAASTSSPSASQTGVDGLSPSDPSQDQPAVTDAAGTPLPPGVFEVVPGQATLIVLDFDALD